MKNDIDRVIDSIPDSEHSLLLCLPREYVRGSIVEADHSADCVIELLDDYYKATGKRPTAPPGGLSMLASLCVLEEWERLGFVDILPPGTLPSCKEAWDEFLRRVQACPQEFKDPSADFLRPRIQQLWHEYFAWSARELIGCSMMLASLHDERRIEGLAEFLLDSSKTDHLLPSSKETPTT